MLSRRELDRLMRTCEPRPPVQINEVVAEVRAEAHSALTLCWRVAMRVGFLDFPTRARGARVGRSLKFIAHNAQCSPSTICIARLTARCTQSGSAKSLTDIIQHGHRRVKAHACLYAL